MGKGRLTPRIFLIILILFRVCLEVESLGFSKCSNWYTSGPAYYLLSYPPVDVWISLIVPSLVQTCHFQGCFLMLLEGFYHTPKLNPCPKSRFPNALVEELHGCLVALSLLKTLQRKSKTFERKDLLESKSIDCIPE